MPQSQYLEMWNKSNKARKNKWAREKYHQDIELSRSNARETNKLSKQRWREAHPGEAGKRSWLFKLKKFHMTEEDYYAIFKSQNGLCAVCGEPETATRAGITLKLAIDHDKLTGYVRGLLCRACNVGLGQFKHHTNILKAAISYLEREPYEYRSL